MNVIIKLSGSGQNATIDFASLGDELEDAAVPAIRKASRFEAQGHQAIIAYFHNGEHERQSFGQFSGYWENDDTFIVTSYGYYLKGFHVHTTMAGTLEITVKDKAKVIDFLNL